MGKKLTTLEAKFLSKLRARFPYLESKLTRDDEPYEGTNFQSDFVLRLDNHERFRGIVIECQGGILQRGKTGHSTGHKIIRDYNKCVIAQINGWFFLPVAPTDASITEACDTLDKLFMEFQELI
jgi:hypothetical protein